MKEYRLASTGQWNKNRLVSSHSLTYTNVNQNPLIRVSHQRSDGLLFVPSMTDLSIERLKNIKYTTTQLLTRNGNHGSDWEGIIAFSKTYAIITDWHFI